MRRLCIFLLLILALPGMPLYAQSDDGHVVIYVNDAGEIVSRNPVTSTMNVLLRVENPLDHAFGFHVSPDGSHLAVFTRRNNPDPQNITFHLNVIHMDSGEVILDQNLLPPDYVYPVIERAGDPTFELTRALGEVIWSPDGRYVAFISGQAGSADVFTFEPGNRELLQRSNLPETSAFMSWNPSGTRLSFSALNSFGSGEGYQVSGFYALSLADGELQTIPLPEPAASSGLTVVGWLDDARLVYAPLNFAVYGANGIFSLDLTTLESSELVPARMATNIPIMDTPSGVMAFVVPEVGEVNLVPGAYVFLPGAELPALVSAETAFYTVERVRPGLFQFESAAGSLLMNVADQLLQPLPANDFGAFVSPAADAVVLARTDGVYVSSLSEDDASLVWAEETQVPIWSPDGTVYYSFGFAPEGAGLIAVDVVNRTVRLLDDRMLVNSPRAVAP
jgi:hypothetical protein